MEVAIDNPDLWFIGFTPYYIAGVWMGYDIQEEIYYSTYPTPIFWKNLMLPIHEGLEAKDFTYSENVKAMQYCTESGDLATENCPSTATGWYKETYIPSSCILHRSASSATQEDDHNTTDSDDSSDSSSSSSSSGSSSLSSAAKGNSSDSSTSSGRKVIQKNESSTSSSSEDDEDGSFWDSVSGLFGQRG